MSKHFLNGKLVEEKELLISPRDLGYMRGYAVFDFFITYDGKPFMLTAHIERLFASAKGIGLRLPWSKETISDWVKETLKANSGNKYEKGIKIIISGGPSGKMIPETEPTIIIMVDERHNLPKELYERGAHMSLVKHLRYSPEAKSNNYIEAVKQIQIGGTKHQLEPIYYDDNQVYEAASSNVFALIKGELLTPKSNVLAGVTRNVLLKILKLNVPVKSKDFKVGDLLKADEVFITASNKEVLPITKIGGKKIGNGKVCPITKEAMRQFNNYIESNKWK